MCFRRPLRSAASAASWLVSVLVLWCIGGPSALAAAVDAQGTVHVPAFDMPFSDLASREAKIAFVEIQKTPLALFHLPPTTPIAQMRSLMDKEYFEPYAAEQRAAFRVTMRQSTIGGVRVEVYTPVAGISRRNAHRVLINIHGGGFELGEHTETQIESIPLAATARIKVISVDYRQGPEYHFPAASEDIAAVYRALITSKAYKPSEIAIYGCSAGGFLTGEAMAWFQKVGLPNPAAIGIFCANTQSRLGDSGYTAPLLGSVITARAPVPAHWAAPDDPYYEFPRGLAYFSGVSPHDPLVCPSASTAVLAKFPPTLLIVGSRDVEESGASLTHTQLVLAGVDARFFVWDGMDHNFMADPNLPESRQAYRIMTLFFEEQFDKAERRHAR